MDKDTSTFFEVADVEFHHTKNTVLVQVAVEVPYVMAAVVKKMCATKAIEFSRIMGLLLLNNMKKLLIDDDATINEEVKQ